MKEPSRCANCGAPYAGGVGNHCDTCDSFRHRHGHLPAAHEIDRRQWRLTPCSNCGCDYAVGNGLCGACHKWQLRHHTPRPAHRWQVFCKDCHEAMAQVKGFCRACYQYRRKNGKRRPAYRLATACMNCGGPVYAKGLCSPCYRHQKKHGQRRPARLWQRWNPQVSTAPAHTLRRCKICGKPSVTQDSLDFHRGRCETCYGYWLRHHHDRPARLWQRWAPNGWCDCGQPAVTEVTLAVDHGAQTYKLCRDCYQLEVEK